MCLRRHDPEVRTSPFSYRTTCSNDNGGGSNFRNESALASRDCDRRGGGQCPLFPNRDHVRHISGTF